MTFNEHPILYDLVDVLQDCWHHLTQDFQVEAEELHHEGFRAVREVGGPGITCVSISQICQVRIGSDIPFN